MAQSKLSYNESDKSLECSICVSDFNQPKLLPCLHTFCLKCLKKYCEEEIAEDLKSCPLCRREFSIPRGGVEKLQDNDFMVKMVSMKKSNEEKSEPSIHMCDPCAEIGENVVAQAFCKECKQCLCLHCKKLHSVQAFSKSHKVVLVEERPNYESLLQLNSSYCTVHRDKELELYCFDCCLLVCYACHFENHGTHNSKLLKEVAKQKKEKLVKNVNRAKECADEGREQLKKIQQEREKTLLEASKATQTVEEACLNIIKLITSCKDRLLNSIETIKASRLEEIEVMEDLVKLRGHEVDSLLSYGTMVMERGTDLEIIRVADELQNRFEVLIMLQDERNNKQQLSDCCIKFSPSSAPTSEDVERLIGKVLDTDTANGSLSTTDVSRNTADGFLRTTVTEGPLSITEGPLVAYAHVGSTNSITSILMKDKIRDFTVMNEDMYVLSSNDLSTVEVYDCLSGRAQTCITIPDMKDPLGIVGCSHNKALYITDWEVEGIYKADLANNTVKCWRLRENYMPFGLSITLQHRILVTVVQIKGDIGVGKSRVIEYTSSNGQKIREIKLHRSIDWAHHAIQLSEDQLVTCHGGYNSSLHRVCVVNFEGKIIKSYGGERGRGEGQLNSPCSLAIDNNRGRVFVADSGNDRVLIFTKQLIFLGQVQTRDELKSPWHVVLDSNSDRLFVSDRTNRVSIV